MGIVCLVYSAGLRFLILSLICVCVCVCVEDMVHCRGKVTEGPVFVIGPSYLDSGWGGIRKGLYCQIQMHAITSACARGHRLSKQPPAFSANEG